MERMELLRGLRKLSSFVKERDAYDAQISQLKRQREQVVNSKNNISVTYQSTTAASTLLDSAEQEAQKAIQTIKVLVWIISLLPILISGANASVRLVNNQLFIEQVPAILIFVLVPITASISTFCFYKIKQGDLGCLAMILCWCFGIFCALEFLFFFAIGVLCAGLSGVIFTGCLLVGILAIVLTTKLKGWQNRLTEKYKNKTQSTEAYRAAESADNIARISNATRKQNAIANKNRSVQKELDSIDSRIRELQRLRDSVDDKLRESTIYPYRDLGIIDKVIDKLDGMRANTLQEALLQCDADSKEHLKRLQEQWRREGEARDRQMQRQRDLENHWAQQRHNYAVEKEQQRQADELESIRRKLEDL